MRITLLDAAVLIHHVMQGAAHPKVGYEDADRTLNQLRAALNTTVSIDQAIIESALWSSILLEEEGMFSHPDGLSVSQLVTKLTPPGMRFNKDFNMWEKI